MAKIFLYVVLGYMLIVSIVCFIMYGIDKRRAVKDKWRIKEQTLLMTGFMGGALGGIIGMLAFRHKTKHWYFYVVNAVSVALWVLFIVKIYQNLVSV
ncbi:MAG: DUF1294 domain-containing protein [Ruminococcus sp.]|nr:DUF1294 domain-containing protein [Ruminococcus sp.]